MIAMNDHDCPTYICKCKRSEELVDLGDVIPEWRSLRSPPQPVPQPRCQQCGRTFGRREIEFVDRYVGGWDGPETIALHKGGCPRFDPFDRRSEEEQVLGGVEQRPVGEP